MRLSRLGKSQIEVSRICFGTLTIGPLQAGMDVEDGANILAHAITRGINFCDTAQIYRTYPYIRRAMELTRKHDLVIATKTYAYDRKLAQDAVEQARRELDRDYIDIFLLHEQESIHTLNGHREALDYLFECKAKGIVRAVGASMHHIAAAYGSIEKELDVIHPLINADGFGIADGSREEMEGAVKSAHAHDIGTYGMKALGGGNLFKQAERCLQYVLGLDYLDSVAVGMQSVDEVDANIEFFENGQFSESSKLALQSKTRRLLIQNWCAGCGNCVERCGQNAIRIDKGKAVCEHEKCLLCGYCASVCPELAVKVV